MFELGGATAIDTNVGGETVNATPLLATPETVTTMLPVVAPVGTGTTILVALQLAGVPVVPLNCTVLVPCVDPNVVPVTVTGAPIHADVGEMLLMFGATVKLIPLLAAPDTVTTTFPVVAPLGTGTLILVELQLVGVPVAPLNCTVLVPWADPKFLPVIVTKAPTGPEVGDKLVILGPAAWVLIAKRDKEKIARTSIVFRLRARIRTCLRGFREKGSGFICTDGWTIQGGYVRVNSIL